VFALLNSLFENNEFETAEHYRKEDLLVYFALSQFEKRKPYIQLPDQLQRDVKAFFGNYNTAIEIAKELLYSISDTELIVEDCLKAHQSLPARRLSEN
jgi:DNA phosphorothioation-associated putative methyltransferase